MGLFQLKVANSFWQRLCGLIGRPPLGQNEALYIPNCRQVHTFFMAYSIDVVFIGADHRVLRVVHDLVPWRWSPVESGAVGCLEFRSGIAGAVKLEVGASVDKLLTLAGTL